MGKKVNSTVTIYPHAIQKLMDAQVKALEQTADHLRREVMDAQVMPYDTGNLQRDNTFVDHSQSKNGKVSIVSQTPYARRLYYHPEYNFWKGRNKNAGGKWFAQWEKGGAKADFCEKTYSALYKKLGGV